MPQQSTLSPQNNRNGSEAQLAADLAGMRRLYELNQRLAGIDSLDTALKEILALAIKFTETDRGNIQLFRPETKALEIVAHLGLGKPFLDHFRYNGCNAACEAALRAKTRVVIEDTDAELILKGTEDLAVFEADGIRAVQSTPLITRQGKVIGMLSTHFTEPHQPTADQFALIDLLASIAADFIVHNRAEQALRENEQKLKEFNNILELQVKERTAELTELLLRQKELEERQQQEIFRTILDTQEVERKRIAETLHNSLGQILYAAKLILGKVNKSPMTEDDKESLKNADKLLNDAITESRRLSHELMPVILEDFGLKTAIEDICQRLSGRTQFKCRFKGAIKRLDKYIEIAIYRLVQELMMNVVKHAEAIHSLIAIEVYHDRVLILVQDDGKGFAASKDKGGGIGLKTIRNNLSLLKGNIDIASKAGNGTIITIDVPF